MYHTYILCSLIDKRYYVGCTNNLSQRLNKHNQGKVKSTKFYKPWKLIYQEGYNTLSAARKRETQIKSWHKRAAIEKLIHAVPIKA